MPSRKEQSASSGERMVVYERARWKHYVRWFGLFVLVLLNVAVIGSSIQSHLTHSALPLATELGSYVVILFFDITVLTPILLEVDSVWVTQDCITFRAMCWKQKVKWEDIISFNDPLYLKFAIVRTPKCFYLLNRRDLERANDLFQTINFKRTKASRER